MKPTIAAQKKTEQERRDCYHLEGGLDIAKIANIALVTVTWLAIFVALGCLVRYFPPIG
jgi:hypothetical protein